MEIDIIDLTDPEYADLNVVQFAMVRAAQAKKDALIEKATTKKEELFRKMVANGTVRSSAYQCAVQDIDANAAHDTEVIKQDLLYQLAYESTRWEGNENGVYRYPENPNYNLTPSQRFLEVRNYYMSVTSDPNARLSAYAGDTLAKSYLGEFYVTLYDLLASYC